MNEIIRRKSLFVILLAFSLSVLLTSCTTLPISLRIPDITLPFSAESHYNRGLQLYHDSISSHDKRTAIAELESAIRIDPHFLKAHLALAYIYSENGKQREIIDRYRVAVRINPNFVEGRIVLGSLYNEQGKHQDAIAECNEALRINPDYAEAHSLLGVTYDLIKNGSNAIQHMNVAVKLFEKAGDSANAAQTIQHLRQAYAKYGYKAEDFAFVEIPESKPETPKQLESPKTSLPRQIQESTPAISAFGTGFVVGSSNRILTSNHIVMGTKTIRVKFQNGEQINAKIVFKDSAGDIALLELDHASKLRMANISLGDSKKMQLGDKVYTMGFPLIDILGEEMRYAEGVISALSGVKGDSNSFQVSVPIQKGNSGSPLFNERNELIGIISSSLDARNTAEVTGNIPQNVNFAVKSSLVGKVLASVPGSMTDTTSIVPVPTSFKEQVKNNIVLIEAE